MRILITGNRGMLGWEMCKALAGHHELVTMPRHELNIANHAQVMKLDRLDLIIHLASETDHEYCDVNPTQCYFVNTVGTGNMVRLAQKLDIPIVYMSTASVFDGSKVNPYEPQDIPNPINHYNTSKYYGELIVQQHPKHYIFRAGWMFGGGPSLDKKFVNKIMNKIKGGQKTIKVAMDCIGSPTYSKDAAEYIKLVIEEQRAFGIRNCINKSYGVSRFQFGKEIINYLGLDVKIEPVSIDELKEEFPCKRTNYEVLSNNFFMRDWKEALKEYLDAYYRH
jgi:dTDP-4-dehydrorhamnose reductase